MSTCKDAIKFDFGTYNQKIQGKFHEPLTYKDQLDRDMITVDDKTGTINNISQEFINTPFYKEYYKCLWYSTQTEKMTESRNGADYVYVASTAYHFLYLSYQTLTLPAISVPDHLKDSVRICWCHNIGSNIVEKANISEGNDEIQSLDSVSFDIINQFFKRDDIDNYQASIGNLSYLENWTTDLPQYHDILVVQPWFYGMYDKKSETYPNAFPIFYKQDTTLKHVYSFRNKVDQLLRVQRLEDGIWKNVHRDEIRSLLNISEEKNNISIEMWGCYSNVTDTELANHREMVIKNKDGRDYHYLDVLEFDADNDCGERKVISCEINYTHPCYIVTWVAENILATSYNNLSNYTNDANCLYRGFDPIVKNTLSYSTAKKFKDMRSIHFNKFSSIFLPSSPTEAGYHAYNYVLEPISNNAQPGIISETSKPTLSCYLETDPIYNFLERQRRCNDIEIEDYSEDNTFKLRVRLFVRKTLNVSYNSENKKFIFIVDN